MDNRNVLMFPYEFPSFDEPFENILHNARQSMQNCSSSLKTLEFKHFSDNSKRFTTKPYRKHIQNQTCIGSPMV